VHYGNSGKLLKGREMLNDAEFRTTRNAYDAKSRTSRNPERRGIPNGANSRRAKTAGRHERAEGYVFAPLGCFRRLGFRAVWDSALSPFRAVWQFAPCSLNSSMLTNFNHLSKN
jgi:hypothetical protein